MLSRASNYFPSISRNNGVSEVSRGVFNTRCSENMQQIYRRTPMPKLPCKSIEITLRHECSTVNMLHIFRMPFYRNSYGELLPNLLRL